LKNLVSREFFEDNQQKGRTGHVTEKIWKTGSTDKNMRLAY